MATGISMLYWRRMENARAKENHVLEQAGASSYLGFHLQRVNGLLATDQNRRRLMDAAEAYREALAGWELVAGPVQVQFAIDHHEEIMAAARMRREVGSQALAPAIDNDLTSGMAHTLIGRLAQLRSVGPRHESFPLCEWSATCGKRVWTFPKPLPLCKRKLPPGLRDCFSLVSFGRVAL